MDFCVPGVGEEVCKCLNFVDAAALACASKTLQETLGPLVGSKKRRMQDRLETYARDFKRAATAVRVDEYATFEPNRHKAFWMAVGTASAADEWRHLPKPGMPHRVRLGNTHVCVDDCTATDASSTACWRLNRASPPSKPKTSVNLWIEPWALQVDDNESGYSVWYQPSYGADGTNFKKIATTVGVNQPPWDPTPPPSSPTTEEKAVLASGVGNEWLHVYRAREDAAKKFRVQQACFGRGVVRHPKRFARFVVTELDRIFEV